MYDLSSDGIVLSLFMCCGTGKLDHCHSHGFSFHLFSLHFLFLRDLMMNLQNKIVLAFRCLLYGQMNESLLKSSFKNRIGHPFLIRL